MLYPLWMARVTQLKRCIGWMLEFTNADKQHKAGDAVYKVITERCVGFAFDDGPGREWGCYLVAGEKDDHIEFCSVMLSAVPESLHGKMAEFVARVNMSMLRAHLLFDHDNGQVRLSSTISTKIADTHKRFVGAVAVNLKAMAKLYDALHAVQAGKLGPLEGWRSLELAKGDIVIMVPPPQGEAN